jgi:hypothetical protein
MNSRTKAFVNLAKSLSKSREGRAEPSDYSETSSDYINTKHIQTLTNCSYSEARKITSLLLKKKIGGVENLSIDEMSEIFPRSRAIEIVETLAGRKYDVSS